MRANDIYLATICIEKNRWAKERRSSIDLFEYIPLIADAGFNGIELWEQHATGLDPEALARARDLALEKRCPIVIYNTYVLTIPEERHVAHRRRLDEIGRALGVRAYKYNITTAARLARRAGEEAGASEQEQGAGREAALRFVRDWAAETDADFLCECHGGTIMEEPGPAAEVLRELGPGRFGAILHSLTDEDEAFERDLEHKKELLRHVHVPYADRHRERIAARVKRLRDTGARLTWSIEFSSPVTDGADNETCFRAAVEDLRFLRSCLAPPR